ncbi:PREDICTED: transmembrane 4 L6 family member 5 [Nanorana parkeri]|uniref:transmembrane 4 L6 family member 5 n=1 Tax=Nanorana parkeri TaxID=125878 RepID=UPI000854FA38|nr:PREDICTED: transmembrane 4 L6 family member 5 [Nanorana parkeri]
MCTGKCSRFVGLALLPLAFIAIIVNLLLIFPNGETKWTNNITMQVWLMAGIGGAGLFMLCPSCNAIRAGGKGCCGEGCCGNRCRMLRSLISSIFGGLGSFYCVAVSGTALSNGPLCALTNQTGNAAQWGYHFKAMEDSYLFNKTSWDICVQPPNIVLWHIVLFSMLLGLGAIEFVLCAVQIINGLLGVMCGDCRKKENNNA